MHIFAKMQRNDKRNLFQSVWFEDSVSFVVFIRNIGPAQTSNIERVHLMACKRYLGVPIRTPNKMVYGELGRFPLFIASYVRCVKYWFRLLQMEHTRLPYQAYRMLISLDENGENCWVTGIREVLCKTGFHCVWLRQGVGDVKSFLCVFKRRLLDMFTRNGLPTLGTKKDM